MNSKVIDRYTVAVLVIILCVAGVLRWMDFHGVMGSDDLRYAELAYRIANGTFRIGGDTDRVGMDISGTRMGLLVPVAAAMSIAGPTEWVLSAYPFLFSLSGIVLAFFAGRLFFGDQGGLLAAALMAVAPMDVSLATVLQSDVPSAALSSVGILLVYVSMTRDSYKGKLAYAIIAGLALGLSWLTRESAVYVLPFLCLYMLLATARDRKNVVVVGAVAMAASLVVAVESAVYWQSVGDPLYRIRSIARAAHELWGHDSGVFRNVNTVSVWRRILFDGPRQILLQPVMFAAMIAVSYATWRKRWNFGFVTLWFLGLAGFYNFGTTSLTQYKPLMLADRYLYQLLFPAVLLVAGLLTELFQDAGTHERELIRERRFWGLTLAVLVGAQCLLLCVSQIRSGPRSLVERAVSGILGPAAPLYTDSRTSWVLGFFWKYDPGKQTHDFVGMRAADIPEGSYVLINRERIEFLKALYGYEPPQFCNDPPEAWIREWQSDRAELYRIP